MTFRRRLSMFVLLAACPLHAVWAAEGSQAKSSEKPSEIGKAAPRSEGRPRTQAPDGTDNSDRAKPAQTRIFLRRPNPSGKAETPVPAKGNVDAKGKVDNDKVDNDKNVVSQPPQGDGVPGVDHMLKEDETLIRKRIEDLAGAIGRSKKPAVNNSSASPALRRTPIDGTRNTIGVRISGGPTAPQHVQVRPATKLNAPNPQISRQKELGRGPAIVTGTVPRTQAAINGTQMRRKFR